MKIIRLSLFNLKKNRREAFAIVFLTMVSTLMLSIYLANSSKIERVFRDSFAESGSVEHIILFEHDRYHDEYRRILENDYDVDRLTENDMIFALNTDAVEKDGSDISYNLTFDTERTERRIGSYNKTASLPEEEIRALKHPVWMPEYFEIVKGYVPGDTFTVVKNGRKYPFTVAGFYETGLMSSDGYGFKLVLSEEDYDLFSMIFKSQTAAPCTALCFDASDDFSFEEYMEKCAESASDYIRSGVEYYSFDREKRGENTFLELFLMLIIFLSAVTLISSAFMIRNKISIDIEHQMRQIGVLEALGYRSGEISLAYLFEYVMTGGAGAILGGIFAALLTPAVNLGIEKMMGRRTFGSTEITRILAAVLIVVTFVTAAAQLSAWSIRKYPPVEALRRGIGSHHFGKNHFPLEKGNANINLKLAMKGLAADMKSAIGAAVCITAAGCAILLALVSFDFFKDGTKGLESMMGIDMDTEIVQLLPGVDPYAFSKEVQELPEVRKTVVSYEMKHISKKGSDDYGSVVVYDDFSDAENIVPIEGRFPEHDNEVMLGMRRMNNEGISVGDTIILANNSMEKDYIVSGYTGSMLNGGSSFYLTSGGYRRVSSNARPGIVNIYLKDGTDRDAFEEKLSGMYGGTAKDAAEEEMSSGSLEERIKQKAQEKIAVLLSQYNVTSLDYAVRIGDELVTGNSHGFIIEEIRSWRGMVRSQMEPMAAAMKTFTLLGAVLISFIVAVILWIIASSNVRRQRQALGIMKSLGYSSKDLARQIALRFMPVIVISLVAASVATVYINGIFWRMMFATVAETDILLIIAADIVLAVFCYLVTLAGAGRVKKVSVTELMTE